MKTATITQTKNNLSAYIDAVKHGETVLILDRNVPVARLEPVTPAAGSEVGTHLAQLERSGFLCRPQSELPREFFDRILPEPQKNVSGVEALIKDRDESL